MSVYDQAHFLASEIKNSPEYQAYLQIKKEVEADATTKNMLFDLQRKNIEIQTKAMKGQEVPPEEIEQYKKLVEIVQMNRTISQYLEAEQRLVVLMNDVQRIISTGLEIGFKEILDEMNKLAE